MRVDGLLRKRHPAHPTTSAAAQRRPRRRRRNHAIALTRFTSVWAVEILSHSLPCVVTILQFKKERATLPVAAAANHSIPSCTNTRFAAAVSCFDLACAP